MTSAPVVISAADHAGWAHFVCVAAFRHVPRVIERRRVITIGVGLPTMPYHHESLALTEDEANALIAGVRRSVAECTSRAFRQLIRDLAPAYRVVALAVRESRFPELPHTAAGVWQSYQLQCAAEGMMYREALCNAAKDLGVDVHQYRRGDEMVRAASCLHVAVERLESFVSVAGRPPGPPWTDEHRRAYAAGIAVLAAGKHLKLQL